MSNLDAELQAAAEELEELKTVPIVSLYEGAKLEASDTTDKKPSGFAVLDSCIAGGFRPGDLTVISGIPGEGKTTFCRMLTMNFHALKRPSMWFSYEMRLKELWESFEEMGATPDMLSFAPQELSDDLDWVFRHIDRAREEKGVEAIFIDTLGDVVKSVKKQSEMNNYANYLAQMCKDLRKYAISHEVMIFVIAHAVKNVSSKTAETSNNDIANSNGIPAAATNIFHVWRDMTTAFEEDGTPTETGTTIVKVGKSRRDGTKKNFKIHYTFNKGRLEEVQKTNAKGMFISANENDGW